MIKNRVTVFCENVYTLADGRHILAGVFTGHLHAPAPTPGAQFWIDAHMQFEMVDAIGHQEFDLRLVNTDDDVVWHNRMKFEVPDFNTVITIAINKVPFPVVKAGTIRAICKEDGGEWTECGALQVHLMPAAPASQSM